MVIEGETGVGKTALVEMLSELWNHSVLMEWNRKKSQILELMQRKLGEIDLDETGEEYMVCSYV